MRVQGQERGPWRPGAKEGLVRSWGPKDPEVTGQSARGDWAGGRGAGLLRGRGWLRRLYWGAQGAEGFFPCVSGKARTLVMVRPSEELGWGQGAATRSALPFSWPQPICSAWFLPTSRGGEGGSGGATSPRSRQPLRNCFRQLQRSEWQRRRVPDATRPLGNAAWPTLSKPIG